MRISWLFGLGMLLSCCSGLQTTQTKKVRRANQVEDPVLRLSHETSFAIGSPTLQEKLPYPWEQRLIGNFSPVTKEAFRCRGSRVHPVLTRINEEGEEEVVSDCEGLQSHSLPVRNGEEFVFPLFIKLLNYLQDKNAKKIVITAGHRCPMHNRYCNDTNENATSKHQIGAEVDFYILGMEDTPEVIIEQIIAFYQNDESPYRQFYKMEKRKQGETHSVWYNREISVYVHSPHVDTDREHFFSHPYLTLELRIDRDTGERLEYTWAKAHNGYMRY